MKARALIPFALVTLACACADDASKELLDAADANVQLAEAGSPHDAAREGNVAMPTDAELPGKADAQAATPRLADQLAWLGRADLSNPDAPAFAWSGAGFEARFRGTGLRITLENTLLSLVTPSEFMFRAVVDGVPQATFAAAQGTHEYVLASSLGGGEHTVALYRQTEAVMGPSRLTSVRVEGGELLTPSARPDRFIEIVGDSISCGYGNLGPDQNCHFSFATESHWDTYGAIAARALDADLSTIAASGYGMYRDYGGTDDTMPPLYELTMPDGAITSFADRHPDVVLINLGTNDFGSRGDPGAPYVDAYTKFVASVRQRHPQALIVLAMGPMFNDPELSQQRNHLRGIMQARRSAGDEHIELLEFPPQTLGELGCDWHPNVRKHEQMGDQLAQFLRARLTW